jgi:hypothetical protein
VLLAIPILYLLSKAAPGSQNPRSVVLMSCLLLILNSFIPVQTFFYFGVVAVFIGMLELRGQGRGMLMWVTAILIAPLSNYFFNVFSFPIRLWLTSVAANVLHTMDDQVSYVGNVILLQGREFSVDMACMGLNLTIASLLTGILLLLNFQIKTQKRLSNGVTILFLMLVLLLNLFSNLVRILFLVKFSILPEQPMHEIAGLVCLLAYVFLPAWGIASFLFSRYATLAVQQKSKGITNVITNNRSIKKIVLLYPYVSLLLLLLVGWRVEEYRLMKRIVGNNQLVYRNSSYAVTKTSSEVLKLENKHALVYIKYISDFFATEHSPMICWKGSGYELEKISETSCRDKKIYKAVLVQGKQKLYTAWWFSNGLYHTTSQLDWRWFSLKHNSSFALVNVTSIGESELNNAVDELFNAQGYRTLFSKQGINETTQ